MHLRSEFPVTVTLRTLYLLTIYLPNLFWPSRFISILSTLPNHTLGFHFISFHFVFFLSFSSSSSLSFPSLPKDRAPPCRCPLFLYFFVVHSFIYLDIPSFIDSIDLSIILATGLPFFPRIYLSCPLSNRPGRSFFHSNT